MEGSFVFMSTCPRCGHPQSQDVFARNALLRSLALGHLIEGYCPACDDLWPISATERTLLARALSTNESDAPPPRVSRIRAADLKP
jgi:hypothetical protein